MAVQEIMQILTGEYSATNAYSFEFRTNKGDRITEIFFLIPPEDYSVSEPWRGELVPTIGGGYHADFGNDFKSISVKGSSHFFFAASAKTGETFTGGFSDAINGFEEFIKLRFMVSRYRDYTMTPGKNLGRFVFPIALTQNASLSSSVALVAKVRDYLARRIGALTDRIEVFWHNYDDDDHFKVKIDSWDTSRSKSDPFTVNWTITMRGMEIDPKYSGFVLSKGVTYKMKTPPESIQDVAAQIASLSPASAPSSLPVTVIPNSTGIPTTSGFTQAGTATTGSSNVTSGEQTTIPSQIAYYGSISSLVSYLAQLRADFLIRAQHVIGGAMTASVAMATIPTDIQTTITAIQSQIISAVVHAASITDYETGVTPLSSFANGDVMAFWADLDKISLCMNDIIVVLNLESTAPDQPISSSATNQMNQSGILMALDTDQFPKSSGNTSITAQNYEWGYYTIKYGDTIPSIATEIFPDGDYSHMATILQMNQLTQNAINSGASIGKVIRYPLQSTTSIGRLSDNMVYEPEPASFTSAAIQKFLYGTDILVQNRKLSITSDGNFVKVSGVDAVVQTFLSRMSRNERSLNPMHPEDGRVPMNDSVVLPLPIRLEKIFSDLENKAMLDPRIASAIVMRKSMKLKGPALFVNMQITPIKGTPVIQSVQVQ